MVECSFTKKMVVGSNPVVVAWISDIVPFSIKEFLDIQVAIKCGFALKGALDTLRTHSQMYHRVTYPPRSSILYWIWQNGWLFADVLSGCGLESRCIQLDFRYCIWFEQRVPWPSGINRVWIHSEICTWLDENTLSNKS